MNPFPAMDVYDNFPAILSAEYFPSHQNISPGRGPAQECSPPGPWVGQAQAWPMRGPPAALSTRSGWPTCGPRMDHAWAAPTRFPGHACPPGMEIFGQKIFIFLPGASQAAGRRGPPVDQPLLVEVRRLGREEFRATWMPSPPDRPDFFPSFA